MFSKIEDLSYRNLLLIEELLILIVNRSLIIDKRQLFSKVVISSMYIDIFGVIRELGTYYYIMFLVTMIKVIRRYLATNRLYSRG